MENRRWEGAAGFGKWRDQENEERCDALEGRGLEDEPELRLIPFEAGQRLGLPSGLHCPLSEVLC